MIQLRHNNETIKYGYNFQAPGIIFLARKMILKFLTLERLKTFILF
jgi:hypothetical protein